MRSTVARLRGGLLALCLAGGCAPRQIGRLEVLIGDDVYDGLVVNDESAGGVAGGDRRATLGGAINETLSLCLVLSARGTGLPAVDVRPSALRGGSGVIPANALTVYRVHQVELRRLPGWHIRSVPPQARVVQVPDVLVPIDAPHGGLPTDLPAGASVTLWVDLNLPKGTAPGTYAGSIDVMSGEAVRTSVDVRLTVWPFVLPDTPDLVLFGELDHQLLFEHHVTVDGRAIGPVKDWDTHPAGGELDNLLTAAMRLLQTHKVTPLLTRLTPVARVDADGNVEVNWDEYDRVVEPFLDGRRFFDRQPLPLWQVPFSEEFPAPAAPMDIGAAMLSPNYANLARQYLARCAEHFVEHGWLDRSFVRLPHLEIGSPQAYEAARHFGRIARLADQRLTTLARLFPQDLAAYGWDGFAWEDVSRYVDVWSPPVQFYDRQEMQDQRARGHRAFWALDHPPFSGSVDLGARPADTFVIGWQARSARVEAVALGTANAWPRCADAPATPQTCCDAGSAPILYPGRFAGLDGPIPSVRLKRLRRSLLDVAYLQLLNDLGSGHIAEVLAAALAPRCGSDAYDAHFADGRPGGWIIEPEAWSTARQIMADEITRAMGRPGAGTADVAPDAAALAETVRWRQFIERSRSLEVVVNGVRAVPTGPPSAGRLEVAVHLTLHNGSRVPLSGTVAWEELPLGWEADGAETAVEEIPPYGSRRVALRALAGVMETDPGGVAYLPLVLRASDGRVHRFAARLAYVAGQPLDGPLVIDGDLADWPRAVANAAEDFVLITGEAPDDPRQPGTRPRHGTQTFVATDGQAIYLGFNCLLDEPAAAPAARQNYVHYEDGVPLGEELIEILLTPENLPARSPADFYHVVVKPHGSMWERGVGADPQVGARRDWPANIRTAVQVRTDRWVAEVRIPLDAFETRRASRAVWGFNVTRFDLPAQEFSNWAGASHNAYDPLAAGNLAWP